MWKCHKEGPRSHWHVSSQQCWDIVLHTLEDFRRRISNHTYLLLISGQKKEIKTPGPPALATHFQVKSKTEQQQFLKLLSITTTAEIKSSRKMRSLFILTFVFVLVWPESQSEDYGDYEMFGNPEDFKDSNNHQGYKSEEEASDDCICVPYYQCLDGVFNVDGIGLLDMRMDNICSDSLDICCKHLDVKPKPARLPDEDDKGCGFRNSRGVGFRITGETDNEAQFGEFPWSGMILRREVIDQQTVIDVYHCGCSLLHPRAAITAAHCVYGMKPLALKLRFGEWDVNSKKELYPHQDVSVRKVILHEKYRRGNLHNDIALLLFDQEVTLGPNVNTMCLLPPSASLQGANCVASGWGKDSFGRKGKYQLIMKKVELKLVSHDSCQSALRSTRLGYHFKLHKSFVCAGGESGKDTCQGDGGSALVCPVSGMHHRYFQMGIVSWGIGCGTQGIPGVYVNVPLFTKWIEKALHKSGIKEFYHKP